jgi:N-methylhydantoinase B
MPGAATDYYVLRGTDVGNHFTNGVMPTWDNLGGEHQVMPSKTGRFKMVENDLIMILGGGGGGLGDPLLRSPETVAKDVADGYTSPEVALEVYGVVLSDEAVNAAATAEQRLKIREQRLGKKPEREVYADDDREVGISVAVKDGHWGCACCGENLGSLDDNYRSGCVSHVSTASEAMAPHGQQVRARTIDPEVYVSEYYCPGCGLTVRADVNVGTADDVVPAPKLTEAGRAAADRSAA